MRILVVGAGIFGCTAAMLLARKGHNVTLADKQDSILRGASTANQLRLHRGFHYPRSLETIQECQRGLETFSTEYRCCIDYSGEQYYAIHRESKTNVRDFLRVMHNNHLVVDGFRLPPFTLNYDYIDGIFSVSEAHINLPVMRNHIQTALMDWDVDVKLNHKVDLKHFALYDKVVIATYGQMQIEGAKRSRAPNYRFELIEKPVVHLWNKEWRGNSLVVLDGPYFSIDPIIGTDYHFLGHVEHCIHASGEGQTPGCMVGDIDVMDFCDKGMIPSEHLTHLSKIDDFLSHIGEIVDMDCAHYGSYFTIRAVKPNADDTDERPTIVTEISDQVVEIFSGKIGCCVDAAEQVIELCSQ